MPNHLPATTTTRALDLRGDADVAPELRGAGLAFGDLVRLTGESVAAAQSELDQNGADTAIALAETRVDVIAVQETEYDENGTLKEGKTYTRELPLVNFIDPPFYQWTDVRVQGHFYASEFASSATTENELRFVPPHTTRRRKVSVGPFSFGSTKRGSTTTIELESERTAEQLVDQSTGRMRLNARLQPRADVTVPTPRQVLRGPRLLIFEGPIDKSDPAEHTMEVTIEYQTRLGEAIPNKTISFETDGLAWEFKEGPESKTDNDGRLIVILKRTFLDEEVDRTPIDTIVTARIGLVSNSFTVSF